jgi:hypothetical protein
MNQELRVIVAGRPKSGKTTLALQIVQLLTEIGIDAEFHADPFEHMEHVTKGYLNNVAVTLPKRIAALKSMGLKVTVEQRQMSRDGKTLFPHHQTGDVPTQTVFRWDWKWPDPEADE